jgi:hypothetical protein
LKVVVELSGENIVLLQHDGFEAGPALSRPPGAGHPQRTGYRMRLEENQIAIPPDLNETKL